MLINCERSLKSERIVNESEKSNATHIATTTTMLAISRNCRRIAVVFN
jgi:hypothetical protein